jgi:hypothetical protein
MTVGYDDHPVTLDGDGVEYRAYFFNTSEDRKTD